MRGRQLIIYLALFVILVSFYLVYDVAFRRKEAKFEESQAQLYSLDRAQVTAISLRNGTDEIHLVRLGGRSWKIDRPVETPAVTPQVDRVIDAALNGKKERVLTGSKADLAEFGLSVPKLSLTLLAGPKKLGPTLFIGGKDPIGNTYYARLGQTREVFTIPGGLFQALNQTLYNLRDKAVVFFEASQIGSLKVESPLAQELKKTSEGQWVILGDPEAPADEAKIDRLLYEGLKGQAASFSPADSEAAAHAFDAPLLKLSVRSEAGAQAEVVVGSAKEKEVEKGREIIAQPEGYWVRTSQRPEVMLVSPATYQALKLAAEDLKDRHLVRFEPEAIQSVDISRGPVVFKAIREDGSWKIVEPKEPQAVADHVVAFLYDLKALEYTSQIQGAASNQALPPGSRIAVKLSGKAGPAIDLTLGVKPVAEGFLPARVGSGPMVRIPADFLKKLPPDAIPPVAPIVDKKVGRVGKSS